MANAAEFPTRAFPDTVDAVLRGVKASRPLLVGLALGVAVKKVKAAYGQLGSWQALWGMIRKSPIGADALKLAVFLRANTGSLLVLVSTVALLWLVLRWLRRERTFLVDFECFECREENQEAIDAAKAEADRQREQARADIDAEKRRALMEIREEVVNLAISSAGKVLRQDVDDDAHRRLVNDFLSQN